MELPLIPDAKKLFMLAQTTEFGIPTPGASRLVGACLRFALKTLPHIYIYT